MENYSPVDDRVFSLISQGAASGVTENGYKYNLCDSCGSAMMADPQKGTYTCDECGSQKNIVGGIDDCSHGSTSVIRMNGSKSTIKHRSGKDTADTIGSNYYKKFVKLNEDYALHHVKKVIEAEKLLRAAETISNTESSADASALDASAESNSAADGPNLLGDGGSLLDSDRHDAVHRSHDPYHTSHDHRVGLSGHMMDAQFYEEMFSQHDIDESYIDLIDATLKTSRIPNDILINVARTYAEIFTFGRKKDYDETGQLLETRESRNRGKKLWGLIAYLLMQECAKNKFALDSDEAILFVSPQQKDVSVTKGERIAHDLNSTGNLELLQLNTVVGDERIEKRLKILGLPEDQFERFTKFTADIMKTVRDEGVGIRTVEKTQIIGSVYTIIKQLGLKIDCETISKKCNIQIKTFTSFHDNIMENRIIFHHVFARYKIPDGLDGVVIRRKK